MSDAMHHAGSAEADGETGRSMRLGMTLPQGCDREYLGVEPSDGLGADRRRSPDWPRTSASSRSGCTTTSRSIRRSIEAPVLEPFVELTAFAMATRSARLGHLVLAAAYRNAALTAKMISTLDVVSGGRAELGIGAGWKEDEWLAYGYGFPPTGERLAILEDHLEVITRMLAPGSCHLQRHARARHRRDP